METSPCSQFPLQDGSQKEMCKSWGREGVSGVSEGEMGQYLLRGLEKSLWAHWIISDPISQPTLYVIFSCTWVGGDAI